MNFEGIVEDKSTMRIQAEVEIVNRDFNTKTKPVRSSLAIGLKPQLTQVRTITPIDKHKQIFEFSSV